MKPLEAALFLASDEAHRDESRAHFNARYRAITQRQISSGAAAPNCKP